MFFINIDYGRPHLYHPNDEDLSLGTPASEMWVPSVILY